MNKEYFAISADVADLMNKVDTYFLHLREMGYTPMIQKSHYFYYGKSTRSSFLHSAGSQKQNLDICINDYRSIVTHVATLVTANRPAFDVKATNTDFKSETQAILGESILEYYLREKKLERCLKSACSYALKYCESFISLAWDTSLGRAYSVDEMGQPVHEGDIKYSLHNPLQVVRDVYNTSKQDWFILVDTINKYELAAKFPEHEEAILNLSADLSKAAERDIGYLSRRSGASETDMVPVYTFYHEKGKVLPEGKVVMFVEGQKLLEGPLPYAEVPVYRIAPDNLDGTCLGYSFAMDLLGIQDASDRLYSAVVSNNVTLAKQVIQTAHDNDINISDLADGLVLVESDAELKPVQLVKSAPETYNLIDKLQSKQQELSGVNEVIRGVPSPNLRSGNGMALIAAQAITYNSGIQGSYNELIEDVGTATIRFLKTYASSPRFASIVGKYKKSYMKEFQGADLESVDRVTVEQQSSVSKTTAGRIQIAENLLQNQMIKRPDQYIMVMETGKLDPLLEPEQAKLLLIARENEMLAEGIQPTAVYADVHSKHMEAHADVLATDARYNPKVVAVVLAHMQEHIQLNKTTDPDILAMTGNVPLPSMQGQPPAPGQPAPTGEGGSPSEVMAVDQGAPPEPPKPAQVPENADAMSQQSYQQLIEQSGGQQ
jgi:hypothetical protein